MEKTIIRNREPASSGLFVLSIVWNLPRFFPSLVINVTLNRRETVSS